MLPIKKKSTDLVTKIKENENTPIYLAFIIGILLGIIIGFLISPIKKGIQIASDNEITSTEIKEDKKKKGKKQDAEDGED